MHKTIIAPLTIAVTISTLSAVALWGCAGNPSTESTNPESSSTGGNASGAQSEAPSVIKTSSKENPADQNTKPIVKVSELLIGAPWKKLQEAGEEKIKAGDYAGAEGYFMRALQESMAFSKHDNRVPETLMKLGDVHMYLERFNLAEMDYRRAVECYESMKVPNPVNIAQACVGVGKACAEEKKYPEARRYYTNAIDLYDKMRGPSHPKTSQLLQELAVLDNMEGKYDLAAPLYERVIKIRREASKTGTQALQEQNQWFLCVAMHCLSDVYIHQNKLDKAEALLEPLPAMYKQLDDSKNGDESVHDSTLDVSKLMEDIADKYSAQKKYTAAAKLYHQALDIQANLSGTDYNEIADKLSKVYKDAGMKGEADKLAKLVEQHSDTVKEHQ